MEYLIKAIQEWATERGIYRYSDSLNQLNGAMAEVYEAREAIIKGKDTREIQMEIGDVVVQLVNYSVLADEDINLSLVSVGYSDMFRGGDIDRFAITIADDLVRLTTGRPPSISFIFYKLDLMAKRFADSDLEQCTLAAYKKIKNRKGAMKNGKWVKDEAS